MGGLGFIKEMLQNSATNRASNTRFAYFTIIICVILIVVTCCFVMWFDTIKEGKNTFDYFTGVAEVLLAAAALVLCAGIPKSLSDKWQNNNKKEEDEAKSN
jgi:bacteriorhodopsin